MSSCRYEEILPCLQISFFNFFKGRDKSLTMPWGPTTICLTRRLLASIFPSEYCSIVQAMSSFSLSSSASNFISFSRRSSSWRICISSTCTRFCDLNFASQKGKTLRNHKSMVNAAGNETYGVKAGRIWFEFEKLALLASLLISRALALISSSFLASTSACAFLSSWSAASSSLILSWSLWCSFLSCWSSLCTSYTEFLLL